MRPPPSSSSSRISAATTCLLVTAAVALRCGRSDAFVLLPLSPSLSSSSSSTTTTTTTTQLGVFDFFKQRTEEGFQQLNNLAEASYKGQLGSGLTQAAVYASETNRATFAGLAKSRDRLLQNLEVLFTGIINPEDLLEELEDVLLQADLGAQTTEDILKEVASLRDTTASSATNSFSRDDLRSILRGVLVETLSKDVEQFPRPIQFSTDPNLPTVLFVMGANGMGKTTTIGKLAYRLKHEMNQTVLIAACDTFRAGAVEQLQVWAEERALVDWVGPCDKAKTPSAVLYKALDMAMATVSSSSQLQSQSPQKKYDTVLVDTSGRLSNNEALTQELAKMKRVIQKRLSVERNADDGKPIPNTNVPHETLLVLDAAQGRVALDSARIWNREIGLTGLVLTKLDGNARGGSVVAVSRDLQLPVKLIGVGEGIEDLRDFVPEMFVDGLLGIGSSGGGGVGVGGSATSIAKQQSSSSEGKMLADRLAAMRQERDARAKELRTTVGGASSVVAPPPRQPLAVGAATSSSFSAQQQQPSKPNRPKNNNISNNNTNKKKKKNRK